MQDYPSDIGLQGDLSITYLAIGVLHRTQREYKLAGEMFDRARTLQEKVLSQNGSNTPWRGHLAETYIEIGQLLIETDQAVCAVTLLDQAVADLDRLVSDSPGDLRFQCGLGRASDMLALAHERLGQFE